MITIIHILDVIKLPAAKAGNYTYIGRANSVHQLPRSPLYNPYSVKQYGREGCIQKYRDEKLAPAMRRLKGQLYEAVERVAIAEALGEEVRLACWCMSEECPEKRPWQQCHGLSIRTAAMDLLVGRSLEDRIEQIKARELPGLDHERVDGVWRKAG